jgi:hypothetical protein
MVKNPKAPAMTREAEENWDANEAALRATENCQGAIQMAVDML